MALEWRTGGYENPRLHYLYRGSKCVGMVSMLGNTDHIRGYSVYLYTKEQGNKFQCVMPTLDEAKLLLQTIAGSQL